MSATTSDNRRVCAFSTGNDGYTPNAVVSLLSFARHNPAVELFYLCGKLSDENRRLCAEHGVRPIELDLSAAFYQEWKYPRECYYHFNAPEVFASMGFDYSVYLDGDMYCNAPLHWSEEEQFDLAGVSCDTVAELFREIREYDKLREQFNAADFDRTRIQSGLLIHNNRALVEQGYFAKAAALFDAAIQCGVPRKGDDSLLALLLAVHDQIRIHALPRTCNVIDFKLPVPLPPERDEELIRQTVVYHFVQDKPWFTWNDPPFYAHKFFVQKWREVMINAFSQEQIARCFPELHRATIPEPAEVPFYWYDRAPNFGDWITPYLVKKVTGRELARSVDPHGTDRGVIISTGSIMRLCGPNTVVWGAGIRDRDQDIKPGKLMRSVRGPITRQRVLEVGGECPPIYGDPALLLPRVFQPPVTEKKHRLGIVPHIDQYERAAEVYGNEPDAAVLDLRTRNVERIVTRILECERVVSSSLHGIVVANAYGVPVRWIKFDDNVFGDDIKYRDHFASIGRPDEPFIDALGYAKLPIKHLIEQVQPYEIDIDLDRLWEAGVFYEGEVSKYVRYVLAEVNQQTATPPEKAGSR